jgi:hypothetical protein
MMKHVACSYKDEMDKHKSIDHKCAILLMQHLCTAKPNELSAVLGVESPEPLHLNRQASVVHSMVEPKRQRALSSDAAGTLTKTATSHSRRHASLRSSVTSRTTTM